MQVASDAARCGRPAETGVVLVITQRLEVRSCPPLPGVSTGEVWKPETATGPPACSMVASLARTRRPRPREQLMPDAYDELAGGAVVLHVVVGQRHLLQAVVDAVYRERQLAGHDRVEDLLEGLPRQVGGVAEVARQADALRQVLVRREVPHRPLVGE